MKDNDKKLLFVSVSEKENTVDIKIKDNGVGIDASILNKICEPYFTTKHKFHGTGLGLFVVNDFIKNEMDGTLEFENVEYSYDSIEYSGTLVKISIPIESKKYEKKIEKNS